jgi:hypothetical protein
MQIAIIGGTGKEGRGLAQRLALAGHSVSIGSRDAERARAAARELAAAHRGDIDLRGLANRDAVARCSVAFLSVPYAAHAGTLTELREVLRGRTLIHLVIPLAPPRVTEVHLPPGQAAALEARQLLDPSTAVVAALHHVGAAALGEPGADVDCDVLVCADDGVARDMTLALLGEIGLRALDAGPLRNAIALEALTPVLLHLNRTYGAKACGIRITGLPLIRQ